MTRSRNTFIGLALLALLLLILLVFNLWRKEEHSYYFAIKGLRYTNPSDRITIGGDDNILFKGDDLPAGLAEISHRAGGYEWTFKKGVYCKINDSTINKYDLGPGDIISWNGHRVTTEQIVNITAPYLESQHYFLIRDIFLSLDKSFQPPSGDSAAKSLLYQDHGKYSVILVDAGIRLQKKDRLTGVVLSGQTNKEHLKLEFVNILVSSFMGEKKLLNNNNINLPAIRTEWQASHIMIRADPASGATDVLFAQPLIVTFNANIIDKITRGHQLNTFYVSQESSVMDDRNFYFESFSNLFPLSVISVTRQPSGLMKDSVLVLEKDPVTGKNHMTRSPLTCSRKFGIVSPLNPDIQVLVEYIYYDKWRFLSPFIFLVLVFLFCALALLLTTHPARFLYHKVLNNVTGGLVADAEMLETPEHCRNQLFKYLRLPVLLTLGILLLIKLIIATKLAFTHPYFPQLYFIGCVLAFTQPLFVTYFWIRNSWSAAALQQLKMGRISIPIIPALTLCLFLANGFVLYLTWQFYGKPFFQNYFASFDIEPGTGLLFTLAKTSVLRSVANPIFKLRHLDLPLLIFSLPILIGIADGIGLFCRWAWNKWILSAISTRPMYDQQWYAAIPAYISPFSSYFVLSVICVFIARVYAPAYILFIFAVFLLFKEAVRFEWKRDTMARLVISMVFFGASALLALKLQDTGFFINFLLPFFFACGFFLVIVFAQKMDTGRYIRMGKTMAIALPILVFALAVMVLAGRSMPDITKIGRSSRRVGAIVHRDQALATGGRQYISDIQFLDIARINATESLLSPSFSLADKNNPFHSFISKGLYPVIINDLNPLVFLSYGGALLLAILGCTWLLLFVNRQRLWTSNFRLEGNDFDPDVFNLAQVVRFLPALFIISNSVWLILSLFDIVFFTGRIINGLGVDSFADWFDTTILCAMMGLVIFNSTGKYKQVCRK